ncbi:sensor histidine kinase [Rhizobium laguerreae]
MTRRWSSGARPGRPAAAAPGEDSNGTNGEYCSGTDTEQAVNVGLLVNELTTNAIKYAFDEGATGTIEVTVAALGDGTLLLFVDDDVKGLPADFDPSTASSLGVRLITSISRQLGGDPKWERLSQGTRFALEFPLASGP